MSVINRMLEDLERRAGPGPGTEAVAATAGAAGHRPARDRLLVGGLSIALAVAVGAAVYAWTAGGPDVADEPAANPDSAVSRASEAGTGSRPTATASPPAPTEPEAAGLRTLAAGELDVTLGADTVELAFSPALPAVPSVTARGAARRVGLPGVVVEGTRLAGLAGHPAIDRLAVESLDSGSRLSLAPAEGRSLAVEAGRQRIRLVFSRPAGAASEPMAPAESSARPDTPAGTGDPRPARPKAAPADPAPLPVATGDVDARRMQARDRDEPDPPGPSAAADPSPPADGPVKTAPATPGLRERVLERLQVGRPAAARPLVEAALAENPDDPRLLRLAARVELAADDPGAALERLATIERPEPATLGLLGLAARRSGDLPAAVAAYGRALRDRPRRADWWMGLAIAYDGLARPGEAAEAYRRALSVDDLRPALARYARQRLAEIGTAGR